MSTLFFYPKAIPVNSTGTPYSGAKANFYLTGTTTRTNTYTTSALSVAHDNPVVADSAGKFAAIYLDPDIVYRVIVTESDDTQIDDVDPIQTALAASAISVADAGGDYTATNVETVLAEIADDYSKIASANTWSADQTFSGASLKMADNVVERPEIKDYAITHNSISSSSGTLTIDMSTGNSFVTTLTENVTDVVINNPPVTGDFGQFILRVIQDGAGGAYTVNFEASETVNWPSATAPVISTGNGAIDKVILSTDDAGANWYGEFTQAYG